MNEYRAQKKHCYVYQQKLSVHSQCLHGNKQKLPTEVPLEKGGNEGGFVYYKHFITVYISYINIQNSMRLITVWILSKLATESKRYSLAHQKTVLDIVHLMNQINKNINN